MMYFGGKARISKYIAEYINNIDGYDIYVEPFCGSCNVAEKINIKNKILNDKHPYLIAMWKKLQEGWLPPTNVSEEYYKYIRKNKDKFPYLAGFVGFGCSFAGKWFEGYARSNRNCNYALSAYNSVLRKISKLKAAEFLNKDFSELDFCNSIIYCDPPYNNTVHYNKRLLGKFDYDLFLEWVKYQSTKNIVLVSEYKHNLPNDAHIVLELNSSKEIRNKNDKRVPTTEILFTFNDI